MQVHRNIADKKFRKLTLQVASEGFSYAITDTFTNAVISTEHIVFEGSRAPEKVDGQYWQAFISRKALTTEYDEVQVLHNNSLNTFVPRPLYDEEFAGSYLQYNTKVFETDFFASDVIDNEDIVNVYIPYVNINNFLIDQFGQFDYRHASSILVAKLLEITKNVEEKQVFVHFNVHSFEIVVAQNSKLVLFNSFAYHSPADFVYYLLFTAEQLKLNPEHFKLHLLGDIIEESENYRLAYKYVRNVQLLETSLLPGIGGVNDDQLRKNFILYQS